MLYADNPRVHYDRPQLAEVICQLRFPAILSIGAKEPAEFQEAVRAIFPRYAAKREQPAPKITGLGTPNARLEQAQPITNYNFISADGKWKLNLTQNFISLSTVAYPGWEHFGQQLDLPLAQFIRIYKPAFFERIGLRYVNIFSRKALDLEGEPWRDLIAPAYLGVLAEEDVNESGPPSAPWMWSCCWTAPAGPRSTPAPAWSNRRPPTPPRIRRSSSSSTWT